MLQTTHTTPANPLDQFYTRPETAAACFALLQAAIPDLEADLYVEPAAGDGVFLDLLPEPRIGMDIAPAGPGIVADDFLAWTPDDPTGRIVVVGNPPFGPNASLAIQFFNTAARYSDVIAMILPASMRKETMQDRLDTRFHLVSEHPLPNEQFRVGDGLHKINAVFQVWRRGPVPRVKTCGRTTHADFDFVTTPGEADFAMRRVGGRAGTILPLPATTVHGYAAASNYFIKSNGINPAVLAKRFRALDFSEVRDCVVANPSVSKREIVTLYEAQVALEAIAAPARTELRIETRLSADRRHVAPYLPAPYTAANGEPVAVIVRQRSSTTGHRASLELVEFRWRMNGAFSPVLRTAIRGKARRQADRLLADLFAGRHAWSDIRVCCDRTTVVFRDGLLHFFRLADGAKHLHLELQDTGDCDMALFARQRDYLELGQAWLADLGELEAPARDQCTPCLVSEPARGTGAEPAA